MNRRPTNLTMVGCSSRGQEEEEEEEGAQDGGGGGGSVVDGGGADGGEGGGVGAAEDSSPPMAGWRVKLYNLDDDGQWADQGTGHVCCTYLDRLGGAALVVVDEDDPDTALLEVRVVQDDIYTRQGDTIITWTEPTTNADLALSFQETEGWGQIWQEVCKAQGRSPDHQGAMGADGSGGAGGHSDEDIDDDELEAREHDFSNLHTDRPAILAWRRERPT